MHMPQFGETELGWTPPSDVWGCGYPTEAARACIDWAFRDFEIAYLTSLIESGNERSIRVANRLRMTPLRNEAYHDRAMIVYSASRRFTYRFTTRRSCGAAEAGCGHCGRRGRACRAPGTPRPLTCARDGAASSQRDPIGRTDASMEPRWNHDLRRICRTPHLLACSMTIELPQKVDHWRRVCAIPCETVKADDGSRTRDLWLGKPTLYQPSYVRVERDSTARLRTTWPGFGGASATRMANGGQPARRAPSGREVTPLGRLQRVGSSGSIGTNGSSPTISISRRACAGMSELSRSLRPLALAVRTSAVMARRPEESMKSI
jgi:hypothetical protein